MKQEVVETVAGAATKATVVVGTATATVGGLTTNEWNILGVIVGIAGTVVMVTFTIWFKLKYQRGD